MPKFSPGTVIKTSFGSPITIESYIAGGGQGDVYKVNYSGKNKALKWYKKNSLKNPSAFYDNLKRNTEKGAPHKAFLWPEAVTEVLNGSFGYVMPLRSNDYVELTDLLTTTGGGFKTFKHATDACINIVSAFRVLHINGYSYQDMNSGNFFINPNNGHVLICDNDNVAPNGVLTGIIGTPQYMAPEVVVGKAKPSNHTDEFSLAIVLFMLLCASHPLEGKNWVCPCLTPDIEKKLYGSKALFIFDPKDNSNRPVNGIHNNVMARWGYMPEYLQKLFTKAFSQDSIKNPNRRVRESDWLKTLVRFRSDIVDCPKCDNEIFINNASDTKCDQCGTKYKVNHILNLCEYPVTAAKGSHIYKCQLGICNADDALIPVGLVIAKKNNINVIGLKNMTNDIMVCTTPSGKVNKVKPKEVVPVKSGIDVKIFDGVIKIN